MKKIRALAIVVVTAVIGFAMASCPTDSNVGNPQSGAAGGPRLYFIDISKETEFDCWVLGRDGASMFIDVDEENTGLPAKLYLKLDKDSDDGITMLFKENGLLDTMIANGFIYYFGNYNGYKFDMAVIFPDNHIEYHYDIEHDVNWDEYNDMGMAGAGPSLSERSMMGRPAAGRSLSDVGEVFRNYFWNMHMTDVLGHAIGLGTCAVGIWIHPLLIECAKYLATEIGNLVLDIIDAIWDGEFSDFLVYVGHTTLDMIGCLDAVTDPIAAIDCVSILITTIENWFDVDLSFLGIKEFLWGEAKTQIEGGEVTIEISIVVINFHPNGGSGPVPNSVRITLYNGYPADDDDIWNVTVPSADGLYKTGYAFRGWNSRFNGGGEDFRPGEHWWLWINCTLYAQWGNRVIGVPENVTAEALSDSEITISWSAVSIAIGYYVYRSDGLRYNRVATVYAPATSYTDSGLSAGRGYYYQVSYFIGMGESNLSSVAWTTTSGGGVPGAGGVGLPVEMVYVQGGTFELGRNLGTGGGADYTPIHTVTVSSFYMGTYEVTLSQWYAVMGSPPYDEWDAGYFYGGTYPAYGVLWYDAVKFCNALSVLEGLTPYYTINMDEVFPDKEKIDPNNLNLADPFRWLVTLNTSANGYRLPTECEWEYAAKGGNPLAPDWVGYTYAGSDNRDDVAWYYGNTQTDLGWVPVGTKAPNRLGLYDMSGNVREWCWDWYQTVETGEYTAFYGYSDSVLVPEYPWQDPNPTGPTRGAYRVLRGGGTGTVSAGLIDRGDIRCVGRGGLKPYERDYEWDVGFRLVRSRL